MGEVREALTGTHPGKRALSTICTCLGLLSIAGCGGAGGDEVVARIAGKPITKYTLVHWMANFASEHRVPDPPLYKACLRRSETIEHKPHPNATLKECKRQYSALKNHALQFLVASQWAIEEASARGLLSKSPTGGSSIAQSPLLPPKQGASRADIEFESKVETAIVNLVRTFERREHVTRNDIERYYSQHIREFERPKTYSFEIWEPYTSSAAAERDMNRVRSGAPHSQLELKEQVSVGDPLNLLPARKEFAKALFSARLHTLVGPEPLLGHYAFFELRQVLPRLVTPMSRVRSKLERDVVSERLKSRLVPFIAAWRARWTARTDCGPGYVVQKCAQYKGPRTPEEPLAFD